MGAHAAALFSFFYFTVKRLFHESAPSASFAHEQRFQCYSLEAEGAGRELTGLGWLVSRLTMQNYVRQLASVTLFIIRVKSGGVVDAGEVTKKKDRKLLAKHKRTGCEGLSKDP